jgi:ABC-type microcin C transport system permease subunit YejB
MTAYVIRRVLWIFPVLWAIATVTFFLMHAVPGGPFDQERELPPPVRANLERKYGLTLPRAVRRTKRTGAGDPASPQDQRPVTTIIRTA